MVIIHCVSIGVGCSHHFWSLSDTLIINGKSFKDIIVDDFRNKAGYYLESNLYNTIDFGIPQKRKRYIFIGSKNKEGHVLDNTPPDFVSEI